MVSICCVSFASLDLHVVCNELHECAFNVGLLVSVCMFIVSKVLLISRATVIFRAGGAI